MKRFILVFMAVLAFGTVGSAAQSGRSFEPYGHIERFSIASKATGRTYSIAIRLPEGYETSKEAYPALFLLDGDYAFDAAVALSSYMQRGEIRKHVTIGISYDVPFGDPLGARRTPDFTPPTRSGVMTKDAPAPYYLFLRDELIPEIARRVRIDSGQKTLWGYSLSGSFVTWLNYFDHSLFRNYILASPNWGEFGIQQRLVEGAVFRAPQQVTQKLFVSFDAEKEMPSPELVGQLRAFFDAGLPGYKVGYVFTHGETHTTAWFSTMPAALRFIYGPDGG